LRVRSPRDASALLLENMRVTMADNGNFMRVSLTGGSHAAPRLSPASSPASS
jgi:hypothetical protein